MALADPRATLSTAVPANSPVRGEERHGDGKAREMRNAMPVMSYLGTGPSMRFPLVGLMILIIGGACSPGELSTEDDGEAIRRRCGNKRCDRRETCRSCPSDCMCDGGRV